MIGRTRLPLVLLVLAAVLGVPPSSSLEAQQATSRFRVLVPYLQPEGDADDDFGEDLSEVLREAINDLATHQPVSEDEMEDATDRFDMDMDEINCVRARQLATQIDAQVVLCGTYTEAGNDQYDVSSQFIVVRNSETFDVDPITVEDEDEGRERASQHIVAAFDRVVQQTRAAQFCQEYYNSQQWENSLQNCNTAIDLNPESISAIYTKARALEKMDSLEVALEQFQRVLELDPVHENALQWAGNVSARLGMEEQGREYYSQYLELNPQDSNVRMNIAYDLAQAGDPEGAMQLLEAGFEMDPDNVDMHEQYGNFAFAAARNAMEEAGLTASQGRTVAEGASEEMPQRVRDLYQTAIESYQTVFEARGEETQSSQLRNVVAAYLQLGRVEDAISFARRAVDQAPEEPQLWNVYANALNQNGQLDQAVAALDSVKSLDPEFQNVAVRQGKWLLDAGRMEDALPKLQSAVESGEVEADVAARLLLADAHSKGVQQENFDYAIQGLSTAKDFPVSERAQAELNFWHGYALYQQAVSQQEPQTVETAEATLPKFQQALQLFQASTAYVENQNSISPQQLQKFQSAAQQYIEIQEAIIERGS